MSTVTKMVRSGGDKDGEGGKNHGGVDKGVRRATATVMESSNKKKD